MLVDALTRISPRDRVESLHSEVERRRATRRRDSVTGADEAGELSLESRQVLAERARDFPCSNGGCDRFGLLLADEGLEDRDHAAVSTTTSILSTSSPRNGPA